MLTFLLVTVASTKTLKMRELDNFPYICYLFQFCKDKDKDILALLNFGSEVNAMTPIYASHLDLTIRVTNFGTQKIDRSSLPTYSIVIAAFHVFDKLSRSWLFQGTFLPADINMKMNLGMLFLLLVILTSNLLRKSSLGEPTLLKTSFESPAQSKLSIRKNLLRRHWRKILKLLWYMSAL